MSNPFSKIGHWISTRYGDGPSMSGLKTTLRHHAGVVGDIAQPVGRVVSFANPILGGALTGVGRAYSDIGQGKNDVWGVGRDAIGAGVGAGAVGAVGGYAAGKLGDLGKSFMGRGAGEAGGAAADVAGGEAGGLADAEYPDLSGTQDKLLSSGTPKYSPITPGVQSAGAAGYTEGALPQIGSGIKSAAPSAWGAMKSAGSWVGNHPEAIGYGLKGLNDMKTAGSENAYRDAQIRYMNEQMDAEREERERKRRLYESLDPLRAALTAQFNGPRPSVAPNPYVTG